MIVNGQHKHKVYDVIENVCFDHEVIVLLLLMYLLLMYCYLQVAAVLERNRSTAIVTVQLEDSKEVLSLSYDDVCQCA